MVAGQLVPSAFGVTPVGLYPVLLAFGKPPTGGVVEALDVGVGETVGVGVGLAVLLGVGVALDVGVGLGDGLPEGSNRSTDFCNWSIFLPFAVISELV